MESTRSTDLALLLMRLFFGIAMIYEHGWGKMLRLFGDEPIRFADPFGIGPAPSLALAVLAEVLCAALLALGLFTRLSAIPLIITMLVASFYSHWGEPFGEMEKSLMYLVAYIALLLTGPGWYSLDARWRQRL